MPNPNDPDDSTPALETTAGPGEAERAAPVDRGDVLTEAYTGKPASPAAAAPVAAPATPAPAEPGEGAGGPQNVPYARFREVNESRRLLEEQLAATQREVQALKASQPSAPVPAPSPSAAPAPEFDVDAAETEYAQALLDGDAKGAAAIRKTINRHIENAAVQRVEQASIQNEVTAKSEAVVANAMAAYPWLDQEEGAEALDLIAASVRAKVADGVPHHVALANAIATIAPRFAPDGTPSRGLPAAPAPTDTRPARAIQRNAADSLLQPPSVQAGIGNRSESSRLDVRQLTDEEYQALPLAERKKLRGD